MISYLKGKVLEKGANHIVVMVGGLGLEVRAPAGTIDKAPGVGKEIALHTYLHVREDALQIYGFDSARSRDLFTKLMSVSGFGAAKALSVLSVFSPEGFDGVIKRGDSNALTVIPGVGKKSAERLLLEMRDKVELAPEDIGVPEERRRPFQEAVAALVQLGYTTLEASEALRNFPADEETSVEKMLQYALKALDRK